ncbi:epsin-2-like [Corticium candelabrum]|uniref:epsin-2-like n=1 Tax=Corticium candelabrum TaxID=121492 RepID=UPI002E3457A0|nr:epsin-2-like [Corticium candelabrum]
MPIRRQLKNVVNNYTDAEVKVREATSNDPWGPSSSLMAEIADSTYNVMEFGQVMGMIWRRLNDHGKNWRHVYKALVVLDYLIKTGSERVYQQCREHVFTVQTLKDFQFVDKDGKDQGVNVREKSKQLVALLKDDDRLRLEREKAMKARERFAQANQAVSSQTIHAQFGRAKKNSTATTGTMSLDVPPSQISPDIQMAEPQFPAAPPQLTAPPAAAASSSVIEQARPSDAVEEDMQLRLALALSKQQAEHDSELRISEEQRIQAAITTSRQEANHEHNSTLLKLSTQGLPHNPGFENDFVSNDPWSVGGQPKQQNPWVTQPSVGNTKKWESMDTPFGAGPMMSPEQMPAERVQSPDDFDLLASLSSATNGSSQPKPVVDAFNMSQMQQTLPPPMATMNNSMSHPQDHDKPSSFLGDHSGLVNVDSLLGTGPQKSVAMPGANPFLNEPVGATVIPPSVFGTSLAHRPSSQPANPFTQVQKPKAKSLNELKATNTGYTTGGVNAPLLPAPLIPDSSRPALAATTLPPQQPQSYMAAPMAPMQGMAMGYPQQQQQNPFMTSGW